MTEPSTWGSQLASTMWVGLYGTFASHPSAARDEADAYRLFYARSSAMGWLVDAMDRGSDGLWGMNDAEIAISATTSPPLALWFQVVLTKMVPAGGVLPVQPFLVCAADVVARLGVLDLQAVQLLVPTHAFAEVAGDSVAARADLELAEAAGWYTATPAGSRTAIELTLAGVEIANIVDVVPEALARTSSPWQDVLDLRALSSPSMHELAIPVGIAAQMGSGPLSVVGPFSGTIAEWSLDAIGWAAALLAESLRRAGTRTPVLLTASLA